MATLVSNWCTNNVSESFIAPLEKRAEKDVPLGNDVPIIDLQQDHLLIVQQITRACKDFGLFQVISNEKFEGSIHRVVTNPARDRVSIATLIGPDYSCTIEPAKELVSQENPPLYKPYPYAEFAKIYLCDKSDFDAGVKPYKINQFPN